MKAKRIGFYTLMAILVLSMLLSPVAISAGNMENMGTASAQTPSYLSKTGATLELLLALAETEVQPSLTSDLGEAVRSLAQTQSLSVSIRFDHELSEAEIAALEAQGLMFARVNDEVAHSGTIYGAEMPIAYVDALKERADVLRIESTWQLGLENPLDVSVPEINADDVWQLLDAGGTNITGEGITIADFDTGIDVFHPDFWQADGGSYNWIDTNGNNVFDPGTDAVDLNGNGAANAGETLHFFDGDGPAGNNDGVFQADMDWLYNDANGNGQRDYGTASGFTETDPTYGELLFIVDDSNSNNALDVGEDVIALGTSKVFRTLNTGGTTRTRGTDLILTDDDTNGHGTSVCGIVNGGIIGRRSYVGVAPNAELLVADRYDNDYTVYIPWARANGADVMIYEFGGWIQQFLDGASNLEQMIDTEAAGGIVQVVPAGNLAGNDKHAQDDVTAGGSTSFAFNVPVLTTNIQRVYTTTLWRTTGNNLPITVTTPTGSVANLPAAPPAGWQSTITGDGHTIWYRREDSTRGTAKYDIQITRNPVITGSWTLQVSNSGGSNEHVDLYIYDDQTSWSGGARWTAFQSNETTVTRPATADSAITVASYSTRGWGVAVGDLSTFSGRGPRIDGQTIVDVAAPGNYDIGSAASNASSYPLGSYRWFGGTSAAGPHVAGVSALILQKYPSLTHGQIKKMLQLGARSDGFTGDTPNEDWGYGKIDALASVNRIVLGLQWLRNHQNPDGSWQNSVGITSMAALAFLNAGHTEDNPTVNKAIQYVLANNNTDGSFGTRRTYETSLAVLALVATHNASYNDEIADARDWLVDAQYDEGEGAALTDSCYGGWRYGSSPSDGDLSNTQFALMALSAAGLPSGNDTWTKAITFTSRCQNRPASNDQAWAHDNTQPSYNDGGFIYYPTGGSLAGGSKSYGSMTAAGIWSLRLCGVGVGDGRVQAGLTWLTNNEDCSFDDNPGYPYSQGHCFLYYYYMTTAKALAMCFLNDLGGVDWYAALSTKLADLQHDDGHWVNAPAAHGQEDIPELATDYALLALQTRQPPAADLWMSIILASNATLTVYDPEGRYARLGDVTIPGATFEIDAEGRQIVNLTELEAGKYRIELQGTADGDYSLTIEGYRDEEQTSSETFEGTIEEGEYQKSDVLVTSMVGALTIYVEEPEPLLVTDLPNVELVSADPTVTSINVTSLNLSEVNETYKPEECITPQSACMVNSTGAGNFTLTFTNIPNANIILVYKINATNQWIDLGATTTDATVTFTMSVEDPPVVFCPGTLPVSIIIEPETLNLASQGVFTAFIQLPEDYNVSDINVSTVECEGAPAVRGMVSEEDNSTYIAKFNRQELVNVTIGDAVVLTVTGNLYDGTPFEGSDTVRVIDKGKGK